MELLFDQKSLILIILCLMFLLSLACFLSIFKNRFFAIYISKILDNFPHKTKFYELATQIFPFCSTIRMPYIKNGLKLKQKFFLLKLFPKNFNDVRQNSTQKIFCHSNNKKSIRFI